MGWWRIDPETGMPQEGASSALSRPPDFVLLNAVPGVDDEADACYLGDGPSDMVSTMPDEIGSIVGSRVRWSADEVRGLFAEGRAGRVGGRDARGTVRGCGGVLGGHRRLLRRPLGAARAGRRETLDLRRGGRAPHKRATLTQTGALVPGKCVSRSRRTSLATYPHERNERLP